MPAFAPAIGLREVLEASPDLVFCCDAWGRFAWVSSSFEAVAGWRAGDLVGQPFTRFVADDGRTGAIRAFLRQRRRHAPAAAHVVPLVRQDGSIAHMSVRVRIYERPDGDAYYVGVAREAVAAPVAPEAPESPVPAPSASDVYVNPWPAPEPANDAAAFDRVAADEAVAVATAAVADATAAATAAEEHARALEKQLDEVRGQSQIKGEFLATLSHEVRVPIEIVAGSAHRLLTLGLAGEQRQLVENIAGAGRALRDLVSDAIDYSRLEAGDLAVAHIDFDLRVALDQVAATLAPAAEARGLAFDARVAAVVPSRLQGDPGRLRQVLLNLGQNALQCAEAGAVQLLVERETEDDTHVTLAFRLERANPSAQPSLGGAAHGGDAARAGGGNALALAISRRLVERMGGQVRVAPQFAGAQSFGFSLTLEKQAHSLSAPAPANVSLRGLRMLVADGADAERAATADVLAAWGVAVETAENGIEALQMLRQAAAENRPYAFAIVDLQIEGLDGEALGSAVRADSDLDGTQLVLTTRFGRPGDAERMKAMGFSAYLVKPVDCSQLFDALTELQGHAQTPPGERPLVTRHSLAEARRGRLRILLVEDDVVNQLVTQSALNRVGYNVEIASHGRAAIELTENQHWDLILMDTQMPGLDGYRATSAIRARERGSRRTPILGLTGDSSFSTDREKCLAAGMDDVFRKPIDLAELTTAVERWTVRSDTRANEPAPEPAHAPRFTVVSSHFDPPAQSAAAPAASSASETASDIELPEGPAIDLEQLNTASMGLPALRTSLLHTYLDDVYPRLERLQAAVDSGDAHRVEFESHGLRGMCATIGASACTYLFGEMESAARDGRLPEASRYLPPAREAVRRTEEFIQRLERMVTREAA